MSASLVGSEMCIRDRFVGVNCRTSGEVKKDGEGSRRRESARCPTPWRGAVSYTHLTLPTICSV
eukprot:1628213-Alexandrium_andersonii.AAC.1